VDLQKRTSPASETALGGRCTIYANSVRHAPSTQWYRELTRAMRKEGVAEARVVPHVRYLRDPNASLPNFTFETLTRVCRTWIGWAYAATLGIV
jgi:hypothetical protein